MTVSPTRETLQDAILGKARVPTTVAWNRLEGRPRRKDFGRALRAEVRDPLWMLTRQWQFGEFVADDAGSPVVAKAAWTTETLTEIRGPSGGARAYDPELPLEATVEARPVPLTLAGRLHHADVRLAFGRRWRQMLRSSGLGGREADFANKYPFRAPDPALENDFPITAHAAAWQTMAAIAGRAIDGGALLERLIAGDAASEGLGLIDPERTQVDDLGAQFLAWAKGLFHQPPDPSTDCWIPRHLEYSARLLAPHEGEPAALAAREHRGGALDWYSFDAVPARPGEARGAKPPLQATSFFPTALQFEGMPNTRHWTFEEGATNFGDIRVDTTDIAKLLLIEFALVFANDWFLLPLDVPAGSLTSIRGLVVTNVFGERFWIEPSFTAAGPARSWSAFKLTDRGRADDRLFVPATAPTLLESRPIEAVALVRDEVANMVWGIETTVQLPDGSSRRGREVALELHAKHQATVPPPAAAPPDTEATIRYALMTTVDEHWIPFIPVHVDGDNREIQLQRAAMPRLLKGAHGALPEKIAPRTRLLREGLEEEPKRPYYLAEEEVERSGTTLSARWQRCRWRGGRVVTWLGYQRTVGRGEASSGLAFDAAVPKPPRERP